MISEKELSDAKAWDEKLAIRFEAIAEALRPIDHKMDALDGALHGEWSPLEKRRKRYREHGDPKNQRHRNYAKGSLRLRRATYNLRWTLDTIHGMLHWSNFRNFLKQIDLPLTGNNGDDLSRAPFVSGNVTDDALEVVDNLSNQALEFLNRQPIPIPDAPLGKWCWDDVGANVREVINELQNWECVWVKDREDGFFDIQIAGNGVRVLCAAYAIGRIRMHASLRLDHRTRVWPATD